MKKRRIIAGTVLAAVALCWALWGSTAKADTVPTSVSKSAVSAPCEPQMELIKPSSNIIIEEPVTESETIPVADSSDSPAQEKPIVIPVSTPAEEVIVEQPAAISEPAPSEEPIAEPSLEETPQPYDGMIYVPGFGWLQSEGTGEWSVSENMYENGNKVGSLE